MSEQTLMWGAFGPLVVIMLVIDIGLNRKNHEISFREALTSAGRNTFLSVKRSLRHRLSR